MLDEGNDSFGFFTWVIDTELDPTNPLIFASGARGVIGDAVRFRFSRFGT